MSSHRTQQYCDESETDHDKEYILNYGRYSKLWRTQQLCLYSTRLKLEHIKNLQTSNFLSFLPSFSAIFLHQKHLRTHLVLFFYVSLFLSLVRPSISQNQFHSQQKSYSDSSFQSWETINSVQHIQENTRVIEFQFPDFIIPAGKLFQFQIPDEAFTEMEDISYYQVFN